MTLYSRHTLPQTIRHALRHWVSLPRYHHYGRVGININTVEKVIRPLALMRKNAQMAGSDGLAGHWPVVALLVETCKLNAVEPQSYLTVVIARIVAGHPQRNIDDLLPSAKPTALVLIACSEGNA